MDQLRKAVAWLKQYHFWVLSVLVALISVGCWWKASAKMVDQYKKSEVAIKGEFESVKKVQSEPFKANGDVNEKQAAETKKQSEGVAKLWQQLYERQGKEVLKWPETLSPEFRAAIEKLSFGAEIPAALRRNYQNYAQGHFKELPKIIGARPYESTGAGAGNRGFGGPEGGAGPLGANQLQDENDYICQWVDTDQAFIHDALYFRDQPSSLRIWVTQEDLWVYETLLRIIAKTNKAANATRMSNAAVKVVAELALGQRAAKFSRTANRIQLRPPVATAATGGEPAPPGPAGGGPEGGQPRMEMSFDRSSSAGPMSEEQERTYLLYGRYLDAQGKPIPFGTPGGAAGGPEGGAPAEAATAAPAAPLDLTAFGTEYKRVPVRMVLQMDQRWLSRLIAQCASEPLQVEVQEVRINVPEASGASSGGLGGIGRGPEGGGGGAGTSMSFPEETQILPFPTHPEIVNVIIQGTIYIFNKPNQTILQGEQPPATNSAQNN